MTALTRTIHTETVEHRSSPLARGPFAITALLMTALAAMFDGVGHTVESRPKVVAGVLFGIVLFFALACLLHDLIPVCHYLFRCDHRVSH